MKVPVSYTGTRIRRLFWSLAILLGFLQAWASRMTLIDDATSYLDMGDYSWRGRWWMAFNGLWNPLNAVILGLGIRLFRPSPYWEYPLVHLILFLTFLFALSKCYWRRIFPSRTTRTALGVHLLRVTTIPSNYANLTSND
jgi:hypothetical protein